MKNIVRKFLAAIAVSAASGSSFAAPAEWDNLKILKIRAVGNYSDATFANTIEVWISNPPNLPSGLSCTVNFRVYINANSKNMVAAAYLPLASGKTVNMFLDDTALPIRAEACEASWLDIPA
jgi:hypothetical protein